MLMPYLIKNTVTKRDNQSGGRLCIPFIIQSLLYSGIELLRTVHNGNEIHWLGFVYRFIVGKSATSFYYIVVLAQLMAGSTNDYW